ncbi:hypothetical protein LKO27_01295 [Tessaracoccus sp. OS52]|uniref:hypothetical protein n=1 Tax=Tessaracoccus sp. OS52 TaxID=2886691 RepID=UPI001D1268C1|nr:hypothetical protein [Tessaracoccus sp. OS52]MCC2592065.1 hypothetical protein [Tessaracoccus sp. OS52]
MNEQGPTDSELRRRFNDVTSGAELAELRLLFQQVERNGLMPHQMDWGPEHPEASPVEEELEAFWTPEPDSEIAIPTRLLELAAGMDETTIGHDLRGRLTALLSDERGLAHRDLLAALPAFQWFLDRAAAGGLELTSSGYLKPDDVMVACQLVPRHWTGYGKNNREASAPEVRHFRECLQQVGLLRKVKGRLLLTRAGDAARKDPWELWEHLGGRLIPEADGFERDAALLFLLHAATEPGPVSLADVADALTMSGWRVDDEPITSQDFRKLPAVGILGNLTPARDVGLGMGLHISEAASILARQALLRWPA